ncbi:MAG TPA: mannose-1-phosphate guanyltransferase [Chloroflexi bacterium]|jgi:mannose-1-phosphate guanylyltransferase|nr:mannose-1-phosphate guanyltransferase [Chloroflexota bacterium]HAL28877.1 mannose-1-phosphate guanyltransferase [Chloroflexota bacterium]
MPRLYALILSGGAGTRLWPRSRKRKPKQFLDLVGDRTMLQDTVERVSELIPNERIFVVAPPEHRALIHEQLPELRADHLVIEPYPRGNAAAIGLAMGALHAFDPDAIVAVLPSDHVVEKKAAFRTVLLAATAAADAGWLVTLGITPERADTGFGYIEAGEALDLPAPLPVHKVKRFIEKPKKDAAEKMVAAGGHYWNAGMFVWRVSAILDAYREHLPKTAQAIDALVDAIGSPRYESVLAEVWEETDRTTVDYGIAERANNMAVVPADIGWQDVGNWSRLADIVLASASRSADEHIAEDSVGNYIYAPGKTAVMIGVNDLIVVDTDDVLLIVAKGRAEEVKVVVDRLAREQKEHLL